MLSCPACGSNIEARNKALGLAACGKCDGVFEWPLVPVPAEPTEVAESILVERRDGSVHALRWRNGRMALVLLLVCVAIAFAGFLVLGPSTPISGPLGDLVEVLLALPACGLAILLPLSIHRAVGTRIELGAVVSVRNGLRRRQQLVAASIRQPFVRQSHRGPPLQLYALCAIQADGTVVTLAEGFRNSVEAEALEHELEAALGIADVPVPGEHRTRAFASIDAKAPLRSLGLACPACATALPAIAIQMAKGQAVCPGCRKVLLVGGQVAKGARTLVLLPPRRATVERSRDTLTLEARLGPQKRVPISPPIWSWTVTVAFLGWCWFLVERSGDRHPLTAFSFVFMVPYVAAVAPTLWLSAVVAWNRVRIRIDGEALRVRAGPIPMRVRRPTPISDITQVFVRAQPPPGFWARALRAVASAHHELCAVDHHGRVIPLVGWMVDLGEARFLEEQIEQYLGIEDAPVTGELEGKALRHEPAAPSVLPGGGNLSLADTATGGELTVPPAAGGLSDPD